MHCVITGRESPDRKRDLGDEPGDNASRVHLPESARADTGGIPPIYNAHGSTYPECAPCITILPHISHRSINGVLRVRMLTCLQISMAVMTSPRPDRTGGRSKGAINGSVQLEGSVPTVQLEGPMASSGGPPGESRKKQKTIDVNVGITAVTAPTVSPGATKHAAAASAPPPEREPESVSVSASVSAASEWPAGLRRAPKRKVDPNFKQLTPYDLSLYPRGDDSGQEDGGSHGEHHSQSHNSQTYPAHSESDDDEVGDEEGMGDVFDETIAISEEVTAGALAHLKANFNDNGL